jgi:hypothetical protein
MQKHWLISAATLALISTGAWAADDSGSAAPATGKHHARTLEEARKHAHEYADKLDKMTESEWNEKQQKRHAWREKWKTMTPEEKAAYKKERAEKWHHKTENGDSSGISNAASPSTAPVAAPPTAASPAVTPPAASPTAPAEITAPPLPTSSAPSTNR